MTTDVDLWESNNHSFIVRIWLEEPGSESGGARWRGQVTQVPTGKRRYVQSLSEITEFIESYLKEWGATI